MKQINTPSIAYPFETMAISPVHIRILGQAAINDGMVYLLRQKSHFKSSFVNWDSSRIRLQNIEKCSSCMVGSYTITRRATDISVYRRERSNGIEVRLHSGSN